LKLTKHVRRGTTVLLRSTSIAETRSAKKVAATERDLVISADVLRCVVRMAAVRPALSHHLAAELRRVD